MIYLLLFVSLVKTVSSTCYTHLNSSTPYPVMQSVTVESQRACEVLCTANTQCPAFAFTPRGLKSWCALLGPAKMSVCAEPKEIFLKKEEGCPARSNISAEIGDDPCIDEVDPAVWKGSAPICIFDQVKRHVVRAVAENGSRITLDNDVNNRLVTRIYQNCCATISLLAYGGGLWTFSYAPGNGYSMSLRVVAVVCATAGSTKCGCAPLPLIPVAGGVPARTDTLGPCANPNHRLHATLLHCSGQQCSKPVAFAAAKLPYARLMCQAGVWMFWVGSGGSFGITGAACAP